MQTWWTPTSNCLIKDLNTRTRTCRAVVDPVEGADAFHSQGVAPEGGKWRAASYVGHNEYGLAEIV